MARTPMLRALQRLAAEHSAAARVGVPVDELRGMRAAHARGDLDRRTLLRLGLGAAVVATGATVAARPASAAAKPPIRPGARVAVVGAGIAGLSAALTLADAGLACTVYEASNRVGGRMYSLRGHFADGQVAEWGGELIDREHQTMLQLAKQFGLQTVDVVQAGPNGAEEVLHFLGDYYPRAQADIDFKPVHQLIKQDLQAALPEATWAGSTSGAVALDNMSLYDWIDSRVPGGHASPLGRFFDVAYNVEYGAETRDQSALALVYLLGYQQNPGHFNVWGLSDERYHIVGGNQQLPEAIAASLPSGTMQHGWQLLAVKANSDGTQTLTFQVGGSTRDVIADHTVLTIPLGVMQRIDLTRAGFDARKTGSLAAMQMGQCTKLNMQFNRRVWTGTGPWPGVSGGDCFTDRPFQQVWDASRGQSGQRGILIQFGSGDRATALSAPSPFTTESTAATRNLANRMIADVEGVYPGLRAQYTGKAAFSAWHLNPLSYGAYAYWPVGYVTRYAGYEGVRQGNVHFAGEHCSYEYQGWMNGSAVSGIDAADEVIYDLR